MIIVENNLVINHRYVLDEILVYDDKKASFLLRFLTRKLTHMEYKELKATPFLNKIYDAIFKELEEEASLSLLKSDKDWNIFDDETSFYFTLCYTLGSAPNYHKNVTDKEITN